MRLMLRPEATRGADPCVRAANFDSLLTLMFAVLHRAHHHHHGHAGRWGGLRTL